MIIDNKIEVDNITVSTDYETGERCGAGGTFQVESVVLNTDYGEIDVTDSIDQGKHYHSVQQVAHDLGFNDDIDVEEI